jgi:hypothetical protein
MRHELGSNSPLSQPETSCYRGKMNNECSVILDIDALLSKEHFIILGPKVVRRGQKL